MRHLSNTRLALQAAEFAREQGVFHAFHSAVFRAYFTDGEDVGDTAVLLDVGERCGLDRGQLALALEEQRFAGQVAQGSEAARAAGVTALPTFLVEDLPPITGAVSEEAFRKALQKAVERQNSTGDSRQLQQTATTG